MTESDFLSKLLPTFDEEDDEDEEINIDDIGTAHISLFII